MRRNRQAANAMKSTPPPTASLAGLVIRRPPKPPPEKEGDITGQIEAAPLPQPQLEPEPQPASEPLRPAPPPAPSQPSMPLAPVLRDDEPPPRAEEIVVYWERLRRGRPFPPLADLDRSLISRGWPDSLIVAFDSAASAGSAMPQVSRLGATNGAIEYTPMVTDWILSRARHAARRGMKLDEVQSFPMDGEVPRYRLLLLPLGAGSGTSDCVLCHLCRVP